jgi:hypothetical protein
MKLYGIYLKMRDAKRGVKVKIRGPITRRVLAFKGEELIKWLRVEFKLSQVDSFSCAKDMQSAGFFAPIAPVDKSKKDFPDDSTLFRCNVFFLVFFIFFLLGGFL